MPNALNSLPATFEQRTAAKAGVSSTALHRHLQAGRIERIGRGLYRQADATPADPDLLAIAHRSRHGTICLTSALAHHGLIDDIPAAWDIAIPRGTTPPKLTNVRWHTFDRATFAIGREAMAIPGTDRQVGLYSAERSIVDALRLRGYEGYETGIDALRAWLRRKGSNPSALLTLARELPRAEGPLREALTYLS